MIALFVPLVPVDEFVGEALLGSSLLLFGLGPAKDHAFLARLNFLLRSSLLLAGGPEIDDVSHGNCLTNEVVQGCSAKR